MTMARCLGFFCLTVSLSLSYLLSTISVNGQYIQEPERHELVDGGDYYLHVDYCPFTLDGTFNFTGRCWCWYNATSDTKSCSIPGPTLIVYNGTSFSLTVVNDMSGSSYDSSDTDSLNVARDPDVLNLHTHGLHISGEEDNVFIVINPGESHTYNYEIESDHYPGTHWYHSHHHGAVGHHLRSGLFGALIVRQAQQEASGDTYTYNTIGEVEQLKWHTMIMHSIWLHVESNCDCSGSSYKSLSYTFTIIGGTFGVHSFCYTWCSMDSSHRSSSGAQFDVESLTGSDNDVDDTTWFFINLANEKTIDTAYDYDTDSEWYENEWHVLKFINADVSYYSQFYFDDDTNCDYYLLSRDGIYFRDGPRDLSQSPTYGYLFIPPGGRADLAMRCSAAGTYDIYTVNSNTHDTLFPDTLEYVPRFEEALAFSVEVVSASSATSSDDIISNLTMDSGLFDDYYYYPLYLMSLLDEDNELVDVYNVYNNCTCYNFDESYEGDLILSHEISFDIDNNECGFELQFFYPGYAGVNNMEFNKSNSLYIVELNTIYEFYIGTNSHPFHQHVNPFQLVDTYMNGIFGEKGDFLDTYATPTNFSYRTITLDFDGHVVVHCHMVDHEDEGMMAYYTVDNDYYECCQEYLADKSGTSNTQTTPSPTSSGPPGPPGGRRRELNLDEYCNYSTSISDPETTTTQDAANMNVIGLASNVLVWVSWIFILRLTLF